MKEGILKDTFGAKAIRKAFGVEVVEPPIPYTKKQLEEAAERDEMLILRIDKDKSGYPLTVVSMMDSNDNKIAKLFSDVGRDKYHRLNPNDKRKSPYDKEIPRVGWKLVSKKNIEGYSTSSLAEQTRILRNTLMDIDGGLTPEELEECSDGKLYELIDRIDIKNQNNPFLVASTHDACDQLVDLQISKNHRRTLVETVYDSILCYMKDKRLLLHEETWTISLGFSGCLMSFYYCPNAKVFIINGRSIAYDKSWIGTTYVY